MGLLLKREEMVRFLEGAKVNPQENFSCMLWGTVRGNAADFSAPDESLMRDLTDLGSNLSIANDPNGGFCFIGLTESCLYVIVLDGYNSSHIIGTYKFPIAGITELKIRTGISIGATKDLDIVCGGKYIMPNVRATSMGTTIKDQKQQMSVFLSAMGAIQGSIPG
jgi:hypothetical protein